jgi:Spy/CpxP family protein refolding chaperone
MKHITQGRFRPWLCAGLIAGSILGAAAAGARPPAAERLDRPRGERWFDELKLELELTPDQESQLQSLRTAQEDEQSSLRKQMRQFRSDLDQEFKQETLNEGRIYAIADQMAANRARTQRLAMENRVAMHKILTPKQRQELSELRAKRMPRRMDQPD